MFRRWVVSCALLMGIGVAFQPAERVALQSQMLPMRDGTRLATDVYLPAGQPPFPVILIRTPYDKNALKAIGEDGARRGYAMVIQDTRGRFASEGANLPFEGDGWWENRADGVDTLHWIAQQPWCNGKIGTWGGSALGINQLMLAGAGTDKLTCQHITVAEPNLHQALFPGGVFKKSLVEEWLRLTQHAPDALQHWTRHPAYDRFWQTRDVNRRYARVNAPAVHIGGYYDIFAQGTLDAFTGYQLRGGRNARGRQKLLMGPWAHGVLQKKVGELEFPNADQPPCTFHDPWRWFEYHLKGVANGVEREPAVVYYVMGAVGEPNAPGNEWRTARQWPPVPTRPTPLYLHGDCTLQFTKPIQGAPLSYRYDPENPVPTLGGRELTLPAGPRDQRAIESRPDVLVFTSALLQRPLEVIGRVKAVLYVSSDAPDTDFLVRLCDVYPDGRSYNIVEGVLRMRYRDSLSREQLMQPGKVYRVEVDLWTTAIVFNAGHRIRVHVTSSSYPAYDPNPNTGAPFRASRRTRVAMNTVYCDSQRASCIVLPVTIGTPAPTPAPARPNRSPK
ncbi:MAG: CocE/NonD family hydrolase [Fimbriimonadales bacterium]|nr:CocE/NonD family hydrolase [Fimbriimonadales bacterium]